MAKLRELLPLFQRHRFCSKCHLCVEFTGASPDNPVEAMIEKVVGGRKSVSLHWLEGRIANALYHAELRQGAAVSDIGLLGSGIFYRESARILADMRPEFGFIREEVKPVQTPQGLLEGSTDSKQEPAHL